MSGGADLFVGYGGVVQRKAVMESAGEYKLAVWMPVCFCV